MRTSKKHMQRYMKVNERYYTNIELDVLIEDGTIYCRPMCDYYIIYTEDCNVVNVVVDEFGWYTTVAHNKYTDRNVYVKL